MSAQLRCILLLLLVSGLGGDADPKAALKAISDYQTKVYDESDKTGVRVDRAALDAKVKAMAGDAIKGVDPDKVAPSTAGDWGKLFRQAGNNEASVKLFRRYLSTKLDPKEKAITQANLMWGSCQLGDIDTVLAMIHQYKATDDFLTTARFVNTVWLQCSGPIKKARGTDAAVRALAEAAAKIPHDPAHMNEDNYLGSGTNESLLKFTVADKQAGLLLSDGRKAEALNVYRDLAKTLDAKNPIQKVIHASITCLTLPGSPAPELRIDRQHGEFPGLAKLRGKVVILDFFAHWCGPCIASFPEMRTLYAELHSRGLEIVGVTRFYGYFGDPDVRLDQDAEYKLMPDFIAKHGLDWPVVYDVDGVDFSSYGVAGIPEAVVISRDGKVAKIHTGYSPELLAEFRKEIEDLLATP